MSEFRNNLRSLNKNKTIPFFLTVKYLVRKFKEIPSL